MKIINTLNRVKNNEMRKVIKFKVLEKGSLRQTKINHSKIFDIR